MWQQYLNIGSYHIKSALRWRASHTLSFWYQRYLHCNTWPQRHGVLDQHGSSILRRCTWAAPRLFEAYAAVIVINHPRKSNWLNSIKYGRLDEQWNMMASTTRRDKIRLGFALKWSFAFNIRIALCSLSLGTTDFHSHYQGFFVSWDWRLA